MTENLTCPIDGRPIDRKWIGKWSDKLWLAYCHCGKVHELVPVKDAGGALGNEQRVTGEGG